MLVKHLIQTLVMLNLVSSYAEVLYHSANSLPDISTVNVLHLQTSLVLDNAFLFLKSMEPVISYKFLNKSSFSATRVYKKINLCLKGKSYCNYALRIESHS